MVTCSDLDIWNELLSLSDIIERNKKIQCHTGKKVEFKIPGTSSANTRQPLATVQQSLCLNCGPERCPGEVRLRREVSKLRMDSRTFD